jgi:hypothetical protein
MIIVDMTIYFQENRSEVCLVGAQILLKLKIVKPTGKTEGENMLQYERTNCKYESRKGTNLIDESSKLTTKKCSIAMIIIDESLSFLTSISVVSTFSKKKNISS